MERKPGFLDAIIKKNKEHLPCVVIEFSIIGVCLKDLSQSAFVGSSTLCRNCLKVQVDASLSMHYTSLYLEDTIRIKKEGQFYGDTLGEVVTH